jgi:hypothetical protein
MWELKNFKSGKIKAAMKAYPKSDGYVYFAEPWLVNSIASDEQEIITDYEKIEDYEDVKYFIKNLKAISESGLYTGPYNEYTNVEPVPNFAFMVFKVTHDSPEQEKHMIANFDVYEDGDMDSIM